jgi:two-component system sensor histidine kinase KdpD
VVVALSGDPQDAPLIRRAGIVARHRGAELSAVHVLSAAAVAGLSSTAVRAPRRMVEDEGGSYHQVVGDDVAAAVLAFARSVGATDVLVGAGPRTAWARLRGRSTGDRLVADAGEIDVHLVAHEPAPTRRRQLPPLAGALDARRRRLGLGLAVAGMPLVTTLLLAGHAPLSVVLLAFLLLVLAVALVGGLWPALLAAVLTGLAENWFFVDPTGRFTIHRVDDVVALLGGLVVAVTVATVVDRSARLAGAAARSRAETELLASLSRSVLAGDRSVPALLEQIRGAFGLQAVSLVERTSSGRAADEVAVTDTLALRLTGRPLAAGERRVLVAFAEQAAAATERARLAAQAAEAERLAAADSMRTALLAAVSHDLRTPLAGIKAASSALRSVDLELCEDDRAELVATIDQSADRLTGLIDNQLDMSRLQAGVESATQAPCDVPAVVDRALAWLDDVDRSRLLVDVPADLPPALADAGLLERVVANLVGNALQHAPGPVAVTAGTAAGTVQLQVVDHGPGVPPAERLRIFAPFQRLGDAPAGQGVGLGLAVARGLTEAMGGSVAVEETPGGGLTMVVSLSGAAAERPPSVAARVPAP